MFPARRRSESDAPASHDAGISLVETLMGIVIMGVAVVAILTGFLSFVGESQRNDMQSKVNAVAVGATEALRDPARTTYANCNSPAYTSADAVDGVTLPTGWTSAVVSSIAVRYWDGTSFQTTCYDNGSALLRLQEITVSVTSPDGRARTSLAVVKRGG
jgi:type II secretory pathway pseudopilin PulG